MTAIPTTQSHLLVPSLTDIPAATYVEGHFVGVQLDSKAQWNVRTDDPAYWRALAAVASEVAERIGATA